MTENQSRLLKVLGQYKNLKIIAEIAPIVSATLLVIVLSLQIAILPTILHILDSEKAQDLTREGILKYRQDRIETENHILYNQEKIKRELDSLKILLRK